MVFLPIKSLPNLLFGVLCFPEDQSHPVCATDNKPSCVLHLLDWFFLLGTKARILGLTIIILIFDSFVALGFRKNSLLDRVYVLQIFYWFYTEDFDMQ